MGSAQAITSALLEINQCDNTATDSTALFSQVLFLFC